MPKHRPLRLEQEAYDPLRCQVLERDGWRCQYCGRRDQLEVHHLQHRSQQGQDCADNLITLCRACHHAVHANPYDKRLQIARGIQLLPRCVWLSMAIAIVRKLGRALSAITAVPNDSNEDTQSALR